MISFSSTCWATPENIEFIFLSRTSSSYINQYLDQQPLLFYKPQFVFDNSFKEQCIPVGDGCFHPQLGIVDKDTSSKKANVNIPLKKKEKKPKKIDKIKNTLESDLISCDKNYHFDLFCGKAQKVETSGRPSDMEIWVDTSSSMRQIDYSKEANFCKRREFIQKVKSGCKKDIKISTYNTSIKSISDLSGVCVNYGLNSVPRLIDWIKRSNAKYLIIVTDIDEMSNRLRSFLNQTGAKIVGVGISGFSSIDLVAYSPVIINLCNKN